MKTLNVTAVAAFLSISASVFAQSPSPVAPGTPGSPTTGGHQHGGRMMKHIDTDGDGQISRAEMSAAHERRMAAFDRADSNGDGKLSREEMRAMGREYRGGHRGPAAPGAPAQLLPRGDGGYGPNG